MALSPDRAASPELRERILVFAGKRSQPVIALHIPKILYWRLLKKEAPPQFKSSLWFSSAELPEGVSALGLPARMGLGWVWSRLVSKMSFSLNFR